MHTVLSLVSLSFVILGGYLALSALRCHTGWAGRRTLQLVVLGAPLVSLGVGLTGLFHFLGRTCFLASPPWDYTVAVALPLSMGLVALGGLGFGVIRLGLMVRLLTHRGTPAASEILVGIARLAEELGVAPPQLRVCVYHRPLALTYGFWRPTVLISTWVVEQLDQRELESVLAHELAHIVRRDYLIVWLATVLRDAFCYVPTSWMAYRQLQYEKELACDDLAIDTTCRPLALASALAKVWQQTAGGPGYGIAQPLVGAGDAMENRIERLLVTSPRREQAPCARRAAFSVGRVAPIALLGLAAAQLAILLAAMGCGPTSPVGKLL